MDPVGKAGAGGIGDHLVNHVAVAGVGKRPIDEFVALGAAVDVIAVFFDQLR